MSVIQLNSSHAESVKKLFSHSKFMGVDVAANWSDNIDIYNTVMFEVFKKTYLSDLNNFKAFGIEDSEGNITSVMALYESNDEPAWYYTQGRNAGDPSNLRDLFDGVLEIQESRNRFKFYTLVNARYAKVLRRFGYSDKNNERYSFYDEYIVPAKTKCYYANSWELLFKRMLLPVDTLVRCSFLKQEYRTQIPVGGKL